MNRHGIDIQPIRIDLRFIYARGEIHIHRMKSIYDLKTTYMNRHGTDIQPIRIDMRVIYAQCEIHMQRYDIHIESIQDRYDIDIRLIDDVYDSAWH